MKSVLIKRFLAKIIFVKSFHQEWSHEGVFKKSSLVKFSSEE